MHAHFILLDQFFAVTFGDNAVGLDSSDIRLAYAILNSKITCPTP